MKRITSIHQLLLVSYFLFCIVHPVAGFFGQKKKKVEKNVAEKGKVDARKFYNDDKTLDEIEEMKKVISNVMKSEQSVNHNVVAEEENAEDKRNEIVDRAINENVQNENIDIAEGESEMAKGADKNSNFNLNSEATSVSDDEIIGQSDEEMKEIEDNDGSNEKTEETEEKEVYDPKESVKEEEVAGLEEEEVIDAIESLAAKNEESGAKTEVDGLEKSEEKTSGEEEKFNQVELDEREATIESQFKEANEISDEKTEEEKEKKEADDSKESLEEEEAIDATESLAAKNEESGAESEVDGLEKSEEKTAGEEEKFNQVELDEREATMESQFKEANEISEQNDEIYLESNSLAAEPTNNDEFDINSEIDNPEDHDLETVTDAINSQENDESSIYSYIKDHLESSTDIDSSNENDKHQLDATVEDNDAKSLESAIIDDDEKSNDAEAGAITKEDEEIIEYKDQEIYQGNNADLETEAMKQSDMDQSDQLSQNQEGETQVQGQNVLADEVDQIQSNEIQHPIYEDMKTTQDVAFTALEEKSLEEIEVKQFSNENESINMAGVQNDEDLNMPQESNEENDKETVLLQEETVSQEDKVSNEEITRNEPESSKKEQIREDEMEKGDAQTQDSEKKMAKQYKEKKRKRRKALDTEDDDDSSDEPEKDEDDSSDEPEKDEDDDSKDSSRDNSKDDEEDDEEDEEREFKRPQPSKKVFEEKSVSMRIDADGTEHIEVDEQNSVREIYNRINENEETNESGTPSDRIEVESRKNHIYDEVQEEREEQVQNEEKETSQTKNASTKEEYENYKLKLTSATAAYHKFNEKLQALIKRHDSLIKRTQALQDKIIEHNSKQLQKYPLPAINSPAGGGVDYVSKNELLAIYEREKWEGSLVQNISITVKQEIMKGQCKLKENDLARIFRSKLQDRQENQAFETPVQNKDIRIVYLNSVTSETYTPSNHLIPSYFYHSLGLSGPVPAPGIIFSNKKIQPYSCWPIRGAMGAVEFELPSPVKFKGLTIKHSSIDEVSAMKRIRLAYVDEHGEKKEIIDGIFDPSKISQSFMLDSGRSTDDDEYYYMEDELEDDENNFNTGNTNAGDGLSCSAVTQSCTMDLGDEEEEHEDQNLPRMTRMILYFDSNWGKKDFTCVYRIVVHGEYD